MSEATSGVVIGTDLAGVEWVCYHQNEAIIERMRRAYEKTMARQTEAYKTKQKLTYAKQRELFGFPIFGKKDVSYCLATHRWLISKTTGFGGDWSTGDYTTAECFKAAAKGKTLQVG